MPLLQTGYRPTWNEAIHEHGAISNVLQSAAIVLAIATFLVILAWRIDKMRTRKPLTDKEQYIGVFSVCGVIIITAFSFHQVGFAVPPAIIIILMLLILILPKPLQIQGTADTGITGDKYLLYDGGNLRLSVPEVRAMLEKRYPYFTKLSPFEKQEFIERTRSFYSTKKFVIHDTSGFREMPVLVSAAAIQLSFGLEKYLLPSFQSIHIYPGEFLRLAPSLHFVIGNVSDDCINVSWKHFLNGFTLPDNGENVGLHEMSHAYYYQNFAAGVDADQAYCNHYKRFAQVAAGRLSEERNTLQKLYSVYGTTNEQEFWAESAEIFFERPVLNQDPLKGIFRKLR